MLSQVRHGLLKFLDCDWSRIDDTPFPALDVFFDLACCFGDLTQQRILWKGCLPSLIFSLEGEDLVSNVEAAAVCARINDYGTVPVQSGGVPERGKVIDMASLSEARKVLFSSFRSHCTS